MKESNAGVECCTRYYNPCTNYPRHVLQELRGQFRELCKRHYGMRTMKKRLHELAEPMHRISKLRPMCPCLFKRKIEIIREPSRRTRTIQLALPSSRRLLLFKKAYGGLFQKERKEIINRNIRYSLLTMYSRLSGANKPQEPIKKKSKWTKKEWKLHRKHFKKLAVPKTPPKSVRLPRSHMPFEAMERYEDLAMPIDRIVEEKSKWVLTDNTKNYKASKRIKQMAQPVQRNDEGLFLPLPTPVSFNAKNYKTSSRIKELAVARDKQQIDADIKENPFSISPNALKYKASSRIEELAEPKEHEDNNIRDNPNTISPAALNAKASPRLIELAKPKGQ